MSTHTPTKTPALRYIVVALPQDDNEHNATTDEAIAEVVDQLDDVLTDGFHVSGYAYPLHELDDATRADLTSQLAELPPYPPAVRERLDAIAENAAHAYVESVLTTPLPGRVVHGTNPTADLLARVSRWEQNAAVTADTRDRDRDAVELLRDAVQVIRTVAVDVHRAAAGDVFDTAMPAYVARWLECRALMLERGHDVHDLDLWEPTYAEVERLAAERKGDDA